MTRRRPRDLDDEPTKDEIRQMNGVWAMEDAREARAERLHRSESANTSKGLAETKMQRVKAEMERASANAVKRQREQAEKHEKVLGREETLEEKKAKALFIKAGTRQ